jgi:outer membrane lipoprotein SlyB
MNIRTINHGLMIAAMAALIFSTAALGQRQAITVQTGRVVAKQQVTLDEGGNAGTGAAIGGMVGLAATSRGRSSSRRTRNAMLGAGVGAAIGNTQRDRRPGMRYTVELGPGSSVIVVTDQTEIRVGDCVDVEQAGQGLANVRRVSAWLCDEIDAGRRNANRGGDGDVDAFMQEAARRCLDAKDRLLDAETDEQIDAAIARVHILCDE